MIPIDISKGYYSIPLLSEKENNKLMDLPQCKQNQDLAP